ncbi:MULTISPECIES: amphi-Trp domain-containing protein [unclassified Haloparvum]|uniref:amphi-Trp domain-containing protein n=1 Tax=Haloparvum sp. PAK95 TaxID=3418962 RepID=UPI003D2EDCF7
MTEETIFEVASTRQRGDIAAWLRTLADELETGNEVTLTAESGSTTVVVPDEPQFTVEVERETPTGGGGTETSLEVELEWREDDDSVRIE